jgi:hypothetical protein
MSTLKYHLPEGWTPRKVATALVREWIPPFRAEPAAKAARWVVQSVVEEAGDSLWEPGISTEEYEQRLNRPDLSWAIRATAGRGKSTILARLVLDKEDPTSFNMVVTPTAIPETLFDVSKTDELLQEEQTPDLFTALLAKHGFEQATH